MVVFEGVDNRSTQDASQRPAPETEKHQRYRNHLQQLNVLEISKKNMKHCIEKKLLYFQQNIAENHQVFKYYKCCSKPTFHRFLMKIWVESVDLTSKVSRPEDSR